MAVSANTVWRVRVGASAATNGGGFDPTVTSPGTNYATQDSPQVSYTDLANDGTNLNKATSAGTPFTSAHVGNVVALASGTRATAGRYTITAVSGGVATFSSNLWTAGAAASDGVAKLGGAVTIAGTYGSDSTVPAFVRHLVAGNTVYILGVAGNASSYPTSSPDYVTTGYMTPPNGSVAAGSVKWVADPGGPMPTISVNGLWSYSAQYQWVQGLYVYATSNSNGTQGVFNLSTGSVFAGNVFNLNNQGSLLGVSIASGAVRDNEFYGGTTSPTASASSPLVQPRGSSTVTGNFIHHGRDDGVTSNGTASGTVVRDNIIYACVGNGVTLNDTTAAPVVVSGNTVDANKSHGCNLVTAGLVSLAEVYNNLFTNHNQTGKAGLYVADGSQSLNDFRARFIGYNWFYNNTVTQGSGTNLSLSSTSVEGTDPGYTNVAGLNWKPTAAGVQAGFPGTIRGMALADGRWIGAVPGASTGGSTVVVQTHCPVTVSPYRATAY